MTEQEKPRRRKSLWAGEKIDTSPVSRLRFTQAEWKFILAAVTFRADSLVREWNGHKPFWGGEYFTEHERDPNSPKGLLWTQHTGRMGEIKNEVAALNLIERQLQLHFGIIDSSFPMYMVTWKRRME